jgi:hypothetical protein
MIVVRGGRVGFSAGGGRTLADQPPATCPNMYSPAQDKAHCRRKLRRQQLALE